VIERTRARRNELAAQLAQAKQEYEAIERMLAQLDRNICAMHGGVQELDALLESPPPDPPPDTVP
jgi:hypothetical protein